MQVHRFNDCSNPFKVWVVKKDKSSHFYINQELKGVLLYSVFERITKKRLKSVLEFTDYNLSLFDKV